MSRKDGKDYLYLVWKDNVTRRQFIVGQLSKNGQYEFQYALEYSEAKKKGFKEIVSFEESNHVYASNELFPVFSSRLPDKKRKDIDRILEKYDMTEYDAYELLKRSGASLPIDNLSFIDPILDFDDTFERKFYVAGARYYLGCCGENCERDVEVSLSEELSFEKEPENEYDPYAIKMLNCSKQMIGYVPRYYSEAFTRLINDGRKISCRVINNSNEECRCDECIQVNAKVHSL